MSSETEGIKQSSTTALQPNSAATNTSVMRARRVPDVPEDIDSNFIAEHWDDPNYDIKRGPPSFVSNPEQRKGYSYSDTESYLDRPESRNSTAIEFDEWVVFSFLFSSSSHHIALANLLILKFVRLLLALMTQICQ